MSWQDDAACAGLSLEMMFPVGEAAQRQVAVHVCGPCLVREVCASTAVASGETDGVWGGLVEAELRREFRRREARRGRHVVRREVAA